MRSDCIWNRQWYWSHCQNTSENISKLSFLSSTVHLFHHNCCF